MGRASGAPSGVAIAILLLGGCVGAPPEGDLPAAPAVAGEAIFSRTVIYPGEYDTSGARSKTLAKGTFGEGVVEVVGLASEVDGARIEIGLVRPEVPEGVRVPVVALASPYFVPLTRENLKSQATDGGWLADTFVPQGYAVALVPVRGSGGAGGCPDLVGPAERADLSQAVTWLGEAEWSSGSVGMIGVSYEGTTPWEVASLANPHLKTIVPVAGWTDLFENAFRNGTASNAGAGRQMLGTLVGRDAVYGTFANRASDGSLVCPDLAEGVLASVEGTLRGTEEAARFFRDRELKSGVEAGYRGSILLAHGFQDMRVSIAQPHPWIGKLEENGSNVKQILGQWDHAYPDMRAYFPDDPRFDRHDWAETVLRWFDRWLKDDPSVDLGARVQVQDSSYVWRIEEAWPPADAAPHALHLTAEGGLSPNASNGAAERLLALDPNAAPRMLDQPPFTTPCTGATGCVAPWSNPIVPCPHCPEFATAPIEGELRFAGLPRLHVTVTPLGPGGQVAGHLYVEDDTGARSLVGRGAINLRFADGSMTPREVAPGQPLLARLQLLPLDVVVPAGSRLVLVVSESNYADQALPTQPFPMRLHVGGDASVLTIDTYDGSTRDFFELPWVRPF